MIAAEITEDMIEWGLAKAAKMPILNHSFKGEEANRVGCIGEAVVLNEYEQSMSKNTFNYDVVLNGKTFEVKTKSRSGNIPKLTYEGSVSNHNTSQQTDFYLFTSLSCQDRSDVTTALTGYIMGYITPQEFYNKCVFVPVGGLGINNTNNYKGNFAGHNILYSSLRSPEGLT
jgi:hypothetical protein